MKHIFRKQLSVILSACMLVSAFAFSANAAEVPAQSESAANSYGLTSNIKDGAILHTWCWSFNTIKENLKNIAEAELVEPTAASATVPSWAKRPTTTRSAMAVFPRVMVDG